MNIVLKQRTLTGNDINEGEAAAKHYGVGHLQGGHSGRYAWGSGKDPLQHARDFLDRSDEIKRSGKRLDAETVMEEFGLSMSEYKRELSICNYTRKCECIATAKRLKEEGMSTNAIGKQMQVNESTVRGWLSENSDKKMSEIMSTVDVLKKSFESNNMVDVGPGVETELGVSRDRLETALYYLESREGYQRYNGMMSQAANRQQHTIQNILCKPGTEQKEIYNYDQIGSVTKYHSKDGGKTFDKFHYPESLELSRVHIRYAETGGSKQDGVIEIRPGCKDLSLGNSNYAQVRILVGEKPGKGTHYLKGMAVYGDPAEFPPGVDVIFNSSKHESKGWQGSLKAIKTDNPENPFGSTIPAKGQYWYTDENGKKKLGLINKRADQNDWAEWSDSLSGQFLSKQSLSLINRQLSITKAEKKSELDEILRINNPAVKKYYLDKFASDCDSTAVHLRAAKLPNQGFHVILPCNTLKENEVYAPNYPNGTKLCLVRYPHGGIFEIPELIVNNNDPTGVKRIGKHSSDAIGINYKVAEQLSGADFDGDTVMAIPTGKNGIKIITAKPLEGLKNFEAKDIYAEHPGMVYMTKRNMQLEMGKITNLITDMTLLGADDTELERAVKHSMVIVDAYKHKLDYKQSAADNNIKQLEAKYQLKTDSNGNVRSGGASTIVSRAKSMANVAKRQGTPKINMPGTEWYDSSRPDGALIYKEAVDAHYTKRRVNKKTGEVKETTETRWQKSTKMAEVDDAYKLVSSFRNADGTMHPKEVAYAEFANSMKLLANTARKEYMLTPNLVYDKEAAERYSAQVNSLNDKLAKANLNKPRERAAQRAANAAVNEFIERAKEIGTEPSNEEIRKVATQALNNARYENGGLSRKDRNIQITPAEWNAIQAGAISNSKLESILNNCDVEILRSYATPRTATQLSEVRISKIQSLRSMTDENGKPLMSIAQIAQACGCSSATVTKYLKEN